MAWGWSTCVDCAGCDPEAINDQEVCRDFIEAMLLGLDMVPIGDPHIMWCETNDPMKAGISCFQLLQDSNITFHLCSATNEAYCDVFSCKPYEQSVVIELVKEYFRPKAVRAQFIDRTAPSLA
jgi:S-adenosylmethionine/arginine decarboxylase-like enzyme